MDPEDGDTRPAKRLRLDNEQPASSTAPLLHTSESETTEREILNGITEFVRPDTRGFSGILKYRYTDFQVHEVQLDGSVSYLKSLKREKKKQEREDKLLNEAAPQSNPNGAAEEAPTVADKDVDTSLSDEDKTRLESIFGAELIDPILALYKAVLTHLDRKPRDFRSVTSDEIADKEARTSAHQAIRQIFQSKLETRTIEESNKIEINKAAVKRQQRGGGYEIAGVKVKGAAMWEDLGGEYTHFTLYKENRDTMEVLGFLAGQLKINVKNFSFGGTKDRRAVTTQRVSAHRIHASKLEGVSGRMKQCAVGDFENQTFPCDLGRIGGNHFTITLRDCHFPGEEGLDMDARVELAKSVLEESVGRFKQFGFINYFGLQRFGSYSMPTDLVGKKMLQGDFGGAVDTVLHFDESALQAKDGSEKVSEADILRSKAIKMWREDPANTSKALQTMPRKFAAEKAIITHLGRYDRKSQRYANKSDFQGALAGIARSLRTMYVHAYQSLVWNHMAGARLARFGPKVVEGDLVIKPKRNANNGAVEIDDEGEVIVRPAEDDRTQTDDDFERARPLTREEAESGRFSLFDIVLPLPGWDVIYPSNEIGKEYEVFMASERGGGLNPHDMRRQWKEISLSGGYRKVCSQPGPGVAYEVQVYESEHQDLVETDLDLLRKAEGTFEKTEPPVIIKEDSQDEHRRIAVILQFQLGTSQYATMALREMLGKEGVRPYQPEYAAR